MVLTAALSLADVCAASSGVELSRVNVDLAGQPRPSLSITGVLTPLVDRLKLLRPRRRLSSVSSSPWPLSRSLTLFTSESRLSRATSKLSALESWVRTPSVGAGSRRVLCVVDASVLGPAPVAVVVVSAATVACRGPLAYSSISSVLGPGSRPQSSVAVFASELDACAVPPLAWPFSDGSSSLATSRADEKNELKKSRPEESVMLCSLYASLAGTEVRAGRVS